MKKLLAVLCAALCIAGCDDVPSAEAVATLSGTLGASAGIVVKLAKVDATTVASINNVLDIVDKVVPNQDQTFEQAWSAIVEEQVEKFLQEGKLNETQAKLVKLGLNAAIKGLDRLFEKKPEWKKYDQVVVGAVGGFISGFRGVIGGDESENQKRGITSDPAEVVIIAKRVGVSL